MARSNTNWVFIVDDDEDDRFLVQQVFNQQSPDSQLKTLSNGAELLETLAESVRLPNLILLDLNMPVMSGLETLERVRQNPAYESVPIVILTTSDQAIDRQVASRLRANGFITKPPTIKQYNEVVLNLQREWLSDTNRLAQSGNA
ncbi:response regulator [Spirosoma utsteinense]|uniref:CheY-like chemotaxis protein n=1 Tax=Spirosoma utsteinense TaxID=2585773 RepID=A0ABR6WAS4_9BACT|nr:response regulator [Spirosoma utsteinense]MBC3787035.1 CheY-like chemotaxis protein [Spirosoma utsteinense]MBC3793384.1 CheY-like chemotaxis protein [Spirosoma utsteinense]